MPVVTRLHFMPSRTAATEPCPGGSSRLAPGPGTCPREGSVPQVSTARRGLAGVVTRASQVVAMLAIVAGVLAVPSIVDPQGSVLPGTPCAEAAPAGDGMQRVAVAVDPGVLGGGAGSLCVEVPVGASGADVLVARAQTLGRPVPRWASNGLLCSLDGVPATGCGERIDGAYNYWAYFLGDGGSWRYAGTGPALRRANPAFVEGWHFVAGAGNASDPPPSLSASAADICPPAPPVTSPPTTTALVAPVGQAGVVPTGGAAGAGAPPGAGGSTTVPAGGGGDTGQPVGGTGGAADEVRVASADLNLRDAPAAVGVPTEGTEGSSMPWAVVVIVGVVAALGVSGVARTRRRAL